MLSVSGKRSSDAWHGCTDVTAISPTMTSNCGAGYCKRGTPPAASCHRGGERTRDYFRHPPKRRSPLFSYTYENQSRGPHRNQRSVSYGESRGLVALLCRQAASVAPSAEGERFVHFPRGFTVLSSMAHRSFYVHFVRIGFGQRLSEPPYIDHAWSISLRFPLFFHCVGCEPTNNS